MDVDGPREQRQGLERQSDSCALLLASFLGFLQAKNVRSMFPLKDIMFLETK